MTVFFVCCAVCHAEAPMVRRGGIFEPATGWQGVQPACGEEPEVYTCSDHCTAMARGVLHHAHPCGVALRPFPSLEQVLGPMVAPR